MEDLNSLFSDEQATPYVEDTQPEAPAKPVATAPAAGPSTAPAEPITPSEPAAPDDSLNSLFADEPPPSMAGAVGPSSHKRAPAGFFKGFWEQSQAAVGSAPAQSARGLQLTLQVAGALDPGSSTDKAFDQAAQMRPGETYAPTVPSFTDIDVTSPSTISTYLGEGAGALAGSAAWFFGSRMVGTAVGGLAGTPLGPEGAAAGAAAGAFAAPAITSYLQSTGDTYDQIMQEPDIQKAIADGKISPAAVRNWSVAGGALVAMVEYHQMLRLGLGGSATKEAAQEAVKQSIKKLAVKEGLKTTGEESVQQAFQEIAAGFVTGNPDLGRRTESVLNAGLQTFFPGAALGAVHGKRNQPAEPGSGEEPGKPEDAINPDPKTTSETPPPDPPAANDVHGGNEGDNSGGGATQATENQPPKKSRPGEAATATPPAQAEAGAADEVDVDRAAVLKPEQAAAQAVEEEEGSELDQLLKQLPTRERPDPDVAAAQEGQTPTPVQPEPPPTEGAVINRQEGQSDIDAIVSGIKPPEAIPAPAQQPAPATQAPADAVPATVEPAASAEATTEGAAPPEQEFLARNTPDQTQEPPAQLEPEPAAAEEGFQEVAPVDDDLPVEPPSDAFDPADFAETEPEPVVTAPIEPKAEKAKKASKKRTKKEAKAEEPAERKWADMSEQERGEANAEYHRENFKQLKKNEPDLTQEEYDARREGGMKMFESIVKPKTEAEHKLSEAVLPERKPAKAEKAVEISEKRLPRPKKKEVRDIAAERAAAAAAPKETPAVDEDAPRRERKSQVPAVEGLLRGKLRSRLRADKDLTVNEGDYDDGLDAAFAKHADEIDSGQHESPAKAMKALEEQIYADAKQAAKDAHARKIESEAKAEAEAIDKGLIKSQEINKERRESGEPQEKARRGKNRGKLADELRNESEKSFREYHQGLVDEQGSAAPQRSKDIIRQFERLAKQKGGVATPGSAKDILRKDARKELERLRAEAIDEQQAAEEAQARAEEERTGKKAETAEERAARQSREIQENARRSADERAERAGATKEAQAHPTHDKAVADTFAEHPVPTDRVMRRAPDINELMKDWAGRFYDALKEKLGGQVPGRLSAKQSKGENFLVAARQYMEIETKDGEWKRKPQTPDDAMEVYAMAYDLDNSTPEGFLDHLRKGGKVASYNMATDDSEGGGDMPGPDEKLAPGARWNDVEEEMAERIDAARRKPTAPVAKLGSTDDDAVWTASISDLEEFTALEGELQRAILSENSVTPNDHGLSSVHGEVNIDPEHIQPLNRVLRENPMPKIGTLFDSIKQTVRAAVLKQLKDVPVYFVTNEQLAVLLGDADRAGGIGGFWMEPSHAERAKGAKGAIVINRSLAGNQAGLAYTVMHESVHGLTKFALDSNLGGTRNIINTLFKEAVKLRGPGGTQQGHENWLYGLTNVDEFVTEAFSSPRFQEWLRSLPLPREMQRQMEGGKPGRLRSLWDAFVQTIARLTNAQRFGRQGTNFMDAVVRAVEPHLGRDMQSEAQRLFEDNPIYAAQARSPIKIRLPGGDPTLPGVEHLRPQNEFGPDLVASVIWDKTKDLGARVARAATSSPMRKRMDWTKSGHMIAEDLDQYVGGPENNPARRVINAMMGVAHGVREFAREGNALVERWATFAKGRPDRARVLGELVTDLTIAQVHPTDALGVGENAHISKKDTTIRKRKLRADHARLQERFKKLSKQEQQLILDTGFYTKRAHEAQSRATIKATMADAIANDDTSNLPKDEAGQDAITDWIMKGGIEAYEKKKAKNETPDAADQAIVDKLGDRYAVFAGIKSMRTIKGFFVPLLRDGEHVVRATEKMPTADGGTAIGNKLVFTDKDKFEKFMDNWEGVEDASVRTAFRDPYTGAKVTSKDKDAERVYIVSPQLQYMEQFEDEQEAHQAARELVQSGDYSWVSPVHNKLDPKFQAGAEIGPDTERKMIANAVKYTTDPALKAIQERNIRRALYETRSRTRMQQRRIRRRKVAGYSTDIPNTMFDFTTAISHSVARLAAREPISTGMRQLREKVAALENQQYGQEGSERAQRAGELEQALQNHIKINNKLDPTGSQPSFFQHALTISFMNHLANAANWILNAAQTVMTTMPLLYSRYGLRNSVGYLNKAYKTIGGGRVLKQGFQNLGRAGGRFVGKSHLKEVDTTKSIRDRLAPGSEDQRAMDEWIKRGDIDVDAGLELNASELDKGLIGKILNRAAAFASAIPKAIESMNRSTTGLAVFWAERDRGASFEEAVRAGSDAIRETQGIYSQADTPQMFRHPIGQVLFQFKKFAHMMARMILKAGKNAFKGATKRERSIARKQLLGLAVTHYIMAGLFGIPFTEPIKILLMLADWIFGTGYQWDDLEHDTQVALSQVMGNRLSEAMVHGWPRLLGIDASSRVGLDTMIMFSTPKTWDTAGLTEWAVQNFAGAPAGTLLSTMDAVANHDITKAPLPRFMIDWWKGIKGASGPKLKKSGRPIPGTQLDTYDMLVRMLGFRPASEARQFEIGSGYEQRAKDKKGSEHDKMMGTWLNVTAPGDRARAWEKIRVWNQGRPGKERIKMSDLLRAKKRRAKEDRETVKLDQD